MTDLDRASTFLQTHARVIDRRRFDMLFGRGSADAVLAALAAYANDDGGFGWALEPDLRAPGSQPVGAFHALELLEEIAPATSPMAARLCDWLAQVSLPDGGLPFALAGAGGPGAAPHWAGADPSQPSLHLTSIVCAGVQRLAGHDAAVAAHPWPAQAAAWCLDGIAARERPEGAYELAAMLEVLDALHDGEHREEASAQLERLAALLPRDGTLPVAGAAEGEAIRPHVISPHPDRPLRRLLRDGVVDADLDRLAGEQHDDGGWDVDWNVFSPAAALEWRGYMTVRVLKTLRNNGRLPA